MMYKGKSSYRDIDHSTDVPELKQSNLHNTHNAIEDTLDQMVIGVNLLRSAQGLEPKFLDQQSIDEIMEKSNLHFGKINK